MDSTLVSVEARIEDATAPDLPPIPLWQRRLVGRLVRSVFMPNRRGGPWPLPEGLAAEPVAFTGNTGARVAGRWFSPKGALRGVVVLVHPDRRYGQHWFVREGRVQWLLARGFATLTFDLPGYGESTGGSTAFQEDVALAADFARTRAVDVPVHVMGVSLGAFAALNASPFLPGVEALVLESPFPTYNAWYGGGAAGAAMWLFDRLFPRVRRHIQGHLNAPHARPQRVLVAASRDDPVTPAPLSRAVADALPRRRTRYLEVAGPAHLDLFAESAAYRRAILAALSGGER